MITSFMVTWTLLAVVSFFAELQYLGLRTMLTFPLTVALAAIIFGRTWVYRVEIVAAGLFLGLVGALFLPGDAFLFIRP